MPPINLYGPTGRRDRERTAVPTKCSPKTFDLPTILLFDFKIKQNKAISRIFAEKLKTQPIVAAFANKNKDACNLNICRFRSICLKSDVTGIIIEIVYERFKNLHRRKICKTT